MSVFKKNLTSKLLKETSLKIIDKQKYPLKILELGCGDGNISKYLASNEKRENIFFASDISKKAIRIAKKNYEKKIDFRTGNLFVPWRKKKFNIIISDVSSINDKVAFFSRWYKNIVCHSGTDGLRNIKNILINIDKYSEKKVIFILPIISLCNVSSLKILLRKKFLYKKDRNYDSRINF